MSYIYIPILKREIKLCFSIIYKMKDEEFFISFFAL